MKCCNSVCDAQGSRVIIVVVQLGGVKIYVAVVEALCFSYFTDNSNIWCKTCFTNLKCHHGLMRFRKFPQKNPEKFT
jgi:hypothetical protein